MKILFHENFLNKRGTSIALFDYAYYNQEILGNESVIITNGNMANDIDVVKKFNKHFEVIHYNDFKQINNIIDSKTIDVFYIIKSGENDGMLVNGVKNVVHSVFNGNPVHKHGDVYATVSEWLSSISNFEIPYVPHMINIPNTDENLRNELGINSDDIVVGRFGGLETFDIDFVKQSIINVLNIRKDITFLFLNTNKFITHNKVIFLEGTSDVNHKTKMINTCDIMLHARRQGESFGLSVLEFACRNKHVITYGLSPEKSHLSYLGSNCSVYNNKNDLDVIFKNLTKNNPYNTLYLNEEFSPINVMDKFKKVFL